MDKLFYPAKKHFSLNTWDYLSDKNKIRRFKTDLLQIGKFINTNDFLFMYMSDVLFIPAFIDFMLRSGMKCKILLNLFHTGRFFSDLTFHTNRVRRIINSTRNIREKLGIYIMVDTEQLQSELFLLAGEKFPILPMFHSMYIDNSNSIKNRKRKQISYLSAAKIKGLQQFVDLITYIKTNDPQLFNEVNFYVRLLAHSDENQKIVHCIHDKVKVEYGQVSDSDYKDLLIKTDIMLLPYLRRYFYARTSGVFNDSLMNKIPVVVTRDTWMGNHAERLGIGEVFDENVPEQFYNAIKKVLKNYTSYTQNRVAAIDEWRNYHSVNNFYEMINKIKEEKKSKLNFRSRLRFKLVKMKIEKELNNFY